MLYLRQSVSVLFLLAFKTVDILSVLFSSSGCIRFLNLFCGCSVCYAVESVLPNHSLCLFVNSV